jgi:hypothetical protein
MRPTGQAESSSSSLDVRGSSRNLTRRSRRGKRPSPGGVLDHHLQLCEIACRRPATGTSRAAAEGAQEEHDLPPLNVGISEVFRIAVSARHARPLPRECGPKRKKALPPPRTFSGENRIGVATRTCCYVSNAKSADARSGASAAATRCTRPRRSRSIRPRRISSFRTAFTAPSNASSIRASIPALSAACPVIASLNASARSRPAVGSPQE